MYALSLIGKLPNPKLQLKNLAQVCISIIDLLTKYYMGHDVITPVCDITTKSIIFVNFLFEFFQVLALQLQAAAVGESKRSEK